MASTPASQSPAVTAEARLIQRQLNITRGQVRLVELGAALVLWLIGVLVYLLALVLIDHWVLSLGTMGRSAALVVLVAGCAAYAAIVVWPLLRRQINPVYAAKAIEDSTPSLKNSLINFLLLQRDAAGTKEAILAAVEKRAASDISHVPIEMAVDRSHIIRLGYLLLALVCFLALYKIRSPKDPFQTVARVLAPWANISTPARVTIRDVSPGDVDVYHGDTITVTCSVLGLREGEQVELVYSTVDGQVQDQIVPLESTTAGARFEAKLPPKTDPRGVLNRGIGQDLVYHLRAGDCVTSEYHVNVSPAPTITVERVIYDYPAYTRKPQQTIVGQGDIQGLEGTRVTVQARANQPIKQATLELDPGDGTASAAEELQMAVDGELATVSFPLQLQADGQTPWRANYQLRFYNEDGNRNPQPILHRIDVTADLPPEIEWLTPSQLKIEVPADGHQPLELRAVDPDFGLKAVRLQAQRGDQQFLNQALLPSVPASPPQATVKFDFNPQQLQLEEGDQIVCWGVAEDGHTSALQHTPESNITRTEPLFILITAPTAKPGNNANDPMRPRDPNDPAQKPEDPTNPQPGKPNQQGQNNDSQNPQQPPGDNPQQSPMEKGSNSPQEDNPQNEQQSGDSQQPREAGQPDKKNKPEENSSEQSEEEKNQKSKGGSQSEDQQPMEGEAGGSEKNQGGGSEAGSSDDAQSQNGGGGGQEGGNSKSKPMNGGESGGTAEGEQGSDGGRSADNGQSSGKKSSDPSAGSKGGPQDQRGGNDGQATGNPPDGSDPSGDPQGNSGGEGSPNSGGKNHKPEHDGEAFDKLLERIKNDPSHPLHDKLKRETGNERPAGDQRPEGDNIQQGEARPPRPGEANQGPKDGQGNKPGDDQKSSGGDESGDNQEDSTGKPNGQPGGKPGDSNGGAGNKPDPMGQGPKEQGSAGKQPQEGTQPGEKPGDKPTGSKPNLPDKKNAEGGQQQAAPGEGGATEKQPRQPEEGPREGESGADANQPKDPGAGNDGQSGAGANSQDKTGNGNDEKPGGDRPKSQSPDSNNAEKGETSPPGESKRQSDSKGGQSGDRDGGGKKGAGQSAGQEGNDGPGSKSAADQGAGKADDQGMGETGTQAGDQEKANGKTGKSGNEAGEGTNSGKPPTGNENNPGQSQEPGKGSPTDKQPNSLSGGEGGKDGQRGSVIGGGKAPDSEGGAPGPTSNKQEVADGEAANLEYTRRATELVIDHLEDQAHNPDPELLKQMGWTKEELQQFVQRWKSLKDAAEDTPAGKQELDESLRSLGLRPPQNRQRAAQGADDRMRDVHDTGSRTAPPNRYRDQFDAFRKGVGR